LVHQPASDRSQESNLPGKLGSIAIPHGPNFPSISAKAVSLLFVQMTAQNCHRGQHDHAGPSFRRLNAIAKVTQAAVNPGKTTTEQRHTERCSVIVESKIIRDR
jgi:hypothetical protein